MEFGSNVNWLEFFMLFLIAGNILALIVGILMFAFPNRAPRWLQFSNGWLSTRKMLKPLEVMRETDRAMLRYPRVLGGVLVVSAAIILFKGIVFLTRIDVVQGGLLLARFFGDVGWSASAWEVLWSSVMALMLLGALATGAVGIIALVRIDTLRYWSKVANQWISTRRATKPLDIPNYAVDNFVRAKPRLWGGVITLLASYTLVMLFWFARAG